jgi:hypothetical protein
MNFNERYIGKEISLSFKKIYVSDTFNGFSDPPYEENVTERS